MPIVLIQNTGSTVRERLWALSLAESSGWDSEDDTEEAHSDTVEIEYKVQFVTLASVRVFFVCLFVCLFVYVCVPVFFKIARGSAVFYGKV